MFLSWESAQHIRDLFAIKGLAPPPPPPPVRFCSFRPPLVPSLNPCFLNVQLLDTLLFWLFDGHSYSHVNLNSKIRKTIILYLSIVCATLSSVDRSLHVSSRWVWSTTTRASTSSACRRTSSTSTKRFVFCLRFLSFNYRCKGLIIFLGPCSLKRNFVSDCGPISDFLFRCSVEVQNRQHPDLD